MRKIIITTVAYFIGAATMMAQDRIITKSGDVVEAYRVDIGSSFIYYTNADNDDAALQKITKADVLMIKKKDNTVINLYEEAPAKATETTSTKKNADETGIVQITPESLSAEGKAANDALLADMNKPVEIRLAKEKNRGNECSWARAVLGVKESSVLANEDIEISVEKGFLYKKNKTTPAVFKSECNFRFDLNPAIRFNVRNKGSKTLYLDLGNSFYVRFGQASCFYTPSSTTTTTSSSGGAGVNLGAVAGAIGIGGAAGTLASGVTVGGGSTSGTSSTTYAQRVVAVPPMSTIALTPQYIFGNEKKELADGWEYIQWHSHYSYEFIINMNFAKDSSEGEMLVGDHYEYQETTSPMQWSFIVAYSETEDCAHEKSLASYFYLKDLCGAVNKEIIGGGELNYEITVTNKKGKPSFPKK